MSHSKEWGLEPGLMSDFIDTVSDRISKHIVGSSRSIARDMVDEVRAYHWIMIPGEKAGGSADKTQFVAQMTGMMYEIWGFDNNAIRMVIDEIGVVLSEMNVVPVQTQKTTVI